MEASIVSQRASTQPYSPSTISVKFAPPHISGGKMLLGSRRRPGLNVPQFRKLLLRSF